MTVNELKDLYGNFSLFVEAFTSVKKTVEKGVLDNNEDLTLYNVAFNDNEFMSFAELGKLLSFLEDYLKLNGVDTTEIKGGRPIVSVMGGLGKDL